MKINHKLIEEIRHDAEVLKIGKGDIVKKHKISYPTLQRMAKEYKIKVIDKSRSGRPRIEDIKEY